MKLIISETIRRKELIPLVRIFPHAHIIEAARKIAGGLGIPLKARDGSILIKLPLTSANGAGRSIWAVRRHTGEIVILLVRKKQDPLGKNASFANPLFQKAVDQALDWLAKDIARGAFEVIDLS